MRAHWVLVLPFAVAASACLIPKLDTGGDDTTATTTITTDGGAVEAGYQGGGCGVESTTGVNLCIATTMCPSLVVDTQAMPHCGFRLRSGVADLVCACGTELCPMGIFDTCDQATALLKNQTESDVCAQVATGRCLDLAATTATTTPTTPTTPTSTSSSSSGGTGCDTQCVKDCGGGEACASVCNCN